MYDADDANAPVDAVGTEMTVGSRVLRPQGGELRPDPSVQSASGGTGKLDTMKAIQLHGKLIGFYRRELDRQIPNRAEMGEDHDFYDGKQWSEADVIAMEDSGQLPMVYNVIASTVNWIIGTEKRGKTDYHILGREKGDGKAATLKTKVMKYLADVNRTPFARSRAFEEAVKVGVGWLECGAQKQDDGEPIYSRYESWRNILHDSAATELDLEDGRYIFRIKWSDLDVAEAMFPNRKACLRLAAQSSLGFSGEIGIQDDGDFPMDSQEALGETTAHSDINGYQRERVRMIEAWFKMPKKVKRFSGGPYSGEVFDPKDWRHEVAAEAKTGGGYLISRSMMVMHVAIMTTGHLLSLEESPYRHNKFPFTPIWCYRFGSDNLPYGVIRNLKMMQRDINKRASKALAILSSNKVIMDEGAVPDLAEFSEEISRPNAIIVKRKGHDLVINADRELAPAHLQMMMQTIALMQSVSGVTDENLGRESNATSGIAIGRRQDQGMLATAGLFDNLRFAVQVHGEKELSLIEQFMTEEKTFRITDSRLRPEYVTVNSAELPESDIAITKADFIISEQDWRASVKQSQVEMLFDLMSKMAATAPQIAAVVMDLAIEDMDLTQRDEIVKRIRSVTGQPDPDADEPSPEEIQKAQQAQAQQERTIAMEEATIAEKQASARQKAATADGMDAKAVLTKVQAMMAALENALAMMSGPHVAPVADGVLAEVGFKSALEGAMQGVPTAQPAAQGPAMPQPTPPPAGPQQALPPPNPAGM